VQGFKDPRFLPQVESVHFRRGRGQARPRGQCSNLGGVAGGRDNDFGWFGGRQCLPDVV